MRFHSKKLGVVLALVICLLAQTASAYTQITSGQENEIREHPSSPSDDIITLTYTVEQPTITPVQNTEYHRITIPHTHLAAQPGDPYLPRLEGKIFIPNGKTVKTIEAQGTPTLVSDTITIAPAVPPCPLSKPILHQTYNPNQAIYTSNQPYPEHIAIATGTYGFRGNTILILSITPVQYYPLQHTLSYYPHLTVTIVLQDAPQESPTQALSRGLSEDTQQLKRMVDNPADVDRYNLGGPSSDITSATKTFTLLIITTDHLKPGFQRLAARHNMDGIRTTIRTLDTDINRGSDYDETCENIRQYIRTAYLNWNIEYVLLGGDEDIIPARLLWADTLMPGYATNIPSDIYYACLDGTYNCNDNSLWGEPNDGADHGDVDLLAEVYVGRACVSDLSETRTFVNKTLWYLNRDSTDQFLNQVELVGEYLAGPLIGQNLVLGDWYMNLLINGSSEYNYTTIGIPSSTYAIETLYDGDWPGFDPYDPYSTGWPKEELISRINNGIHILNHLGHSGNFYNMKLYVSDVQALSNDDLMFVYSQGCTAGAFDEDAYGYEDCIAEHFTTKTQHGAFAGIWNAREGWFSPTSNDSSSQRINREFWDAVFGEGKAVISVANQDSKEDCLSEIFYDSTIRWCFYQLNYFGDPTVSFNNMPLRADTNGPFDVLIKEPIQFHGYAYGGTLPYRSWEWDFGDGTYVRGQHPIHSYTSYGVKRISLTVKDHAGIININTTTAIIRPPVVWVDDEYAPDQYNDGHTWGTDAFDTIQDAVNMVLPGGIVSVAEGYYGGRIIITKPLSLSGTSPAEVIIDGLFQGDVVEVCASNVTVANVTITKSYYQKSGVLSHQYCDNIRITNCILSDNEYSTSFFCSNETIITENVFLNNSFGVKTYQFNRGIISQNTFIDCGEAVDVYTSNSNIITNNTIVGTSEPPSGLGIKLSQSNNCTVADNTISDIIIGINIVFQQSQYNYIVRNTIQHCRDGLYLSQAKVNTIVDNIIDSNTNTGITLTSNAKNNIITNNIFSNTTGNGIYIHQYSTANLIEHNRIENNQGNGLYLYYYGAPNVIRHNIIRNNTLNGIFIKSSYQALIYHNIFMNQNNALVQFGNAVWDDGYPSGGNYWSNYTGVDEFSGPNQDEPGSDGIGDIPYGIPGDGSDRYPLMMMPE